MSPSLRLPHPAQHLLVFHIQLLVQTDLYQDTVCSGAAINSTFQAAGIVLNFVTCPRALLSHLLKLFSARDHCINRMKHRDDVRIRFYFHRVPLRHHSLTDISDKIKCKRVTKLKKERGILYKVFSNTLCETHFSGKDSTFLQRSN